MIQLDTPARRVSALRAEMKKRNIDIYIVPTADFHESEYTGEFFHAREYLSGFTGSAGTLVVSENEAWLWTDGRYFIQAEHELSGSGIGLMKSGVESVPKIPEYVRENLPSGGTIGFDGRVINADAAKKYEDIAVERGGRVYAGEDLAGLIWPDRPPLPENPVWILADEYSGESTSSKLSRVRADVDKLGADAHFLSSLCDIAWILNLRGGDIEHLPVFLSFLYIAKDSAVLFINENDIGSEARAYLSALGVEIRAYEAVYKFAEEIGDTLQKAEPKLLLDKKSVNYRLVSLFSEKLEIIDKPNPSELMKCVKNETEINNTKLAHIKDGVAVTKFMYWLKKCAAAAKVKCPDTGNDGADAERPAGVSGENKENYNAKECAALRDIDAPGRPVIDEYYAGQKLDALRAEQEHFLDLSFSNICAYGPNAAMMHYEATQDLKSELRTGGMFLVDSGGHYLEGTTDITRTFVLGDIPYEQKKYFTAVLRGNLALANARFLKGCSGQSFDVLARGPLWDVGMDYRCGTGHGVGHILSVHEGPNGFRYKTVPERVDSGEIRPGMITTDEPGVYIEGEFGIRIENELLCVNSVKNEYGQFMEFENITLCPIDLDGVLPDKMQPREVEWLNAYHAKVRETLSPYLDDDEREWLFGATENV